MGGPCRVFISYAWETSEFKNDVWNFAGWLNKASKGDIKPISDHLFSNRPPEKGWYVWMQEEIKNADVVLVICTPKYIARFEKQEPVNENGLGATFEGAIITTEFYSLKGANNKFYPIIPDGGSHINVPTILRAYNNGHTFSKDNLRILDLIYGNNPTHESTDRYLTGVNEQIEQEKTIVSEAISIASEKQDEQTIMTPIQVTVRAYLGLDEVSKESVCRKMNLIVPGFQQLKPFDRDKNIIKEISERNLLPEFWDAINSIKQFENSTNPFKN